MARSLAEKRSILADCEAQLFVAMAKLESEPTQDIAPPYHESTQDLIDELHEAIEFWKQEVASHRGSLSLAGGGS